MTNTHQNVQEAQGYDLKKADKINVIIIWALLAILVEQSYVRGEDVFSVMLQAVPVGIAVNIIYFLKIRRFVKSLLIGLIPTLVNCLTFYLEPFSVDRHYIFIMTIAVITLYFNYKLLLTYGGILNALYIALFIITPEHLLGTDPSFAFFMSVILMLNGLMALMYFLTRWGNSLIKKMADSNSRMNELLTQVQDASRQDKLQMEYQKSETKKVLESLERLSQGELKCHIQLEEPDDTMRESYVMFRNISDKLSESVGTIQGYITELTGAFGEMAKGNLNVRIESEYKGDFTALKGALNDIAASLGGLIKSIRTAADQVSTGALQVSGGNQAASQNVSQQAGSVQNITAAMMGIAQRTKQSAEQASLANQMTASARDEAETGNARMENLRLAMDKIGEASNSIGSIMKTIEDIAFQTNILALNAAVEAARAGIHGKGFAVVAEEVRNLANRSAEAAGRTGELIAESAERTKAGKRIAGETADSLAHIVESIEKAASIVSGIAESCSGQAEDIAKINAGFGKMSGIIQNNAAAAQQIAAVSEELSSQADGLKSIVGQFSV